MILSFLYYIDNDTNHAINPILLILITSYFSTKIQYFATRTVDNLLYLNIVKYSTLLLIIIDDCRAKNAEMSNAERHEEEVQDAVANETTVCAENKSSYVLHGRRIVQIADLFDQIKELDHHSSLFDCRFSDMKLTGERRQGLRSGFLFKCVMCNFNKTIWSEKRWNNKIDANTSAASGTMTTGGG